MQKEKMSSKNIIKWILILSVMLGILYALFFILLVINRKTITIPAPPDKAVYYTPTPVQPTLSISQTPIASPTAQGKFCGGIAGRPCPTGYTCKLAGNYPDAGGTCIQQSVTITPSQKICSMIAKQCPDGSSVSRSGPNCEFAQCPIPN